MCIQSSCTSVYNHTLDTNIDPTVDINKADYVEFDFYTESDTSLTFCLGSYSEVPSQMTGTNFNFYDIRSDYVSTQVKKGWNHVEFPTSNLKKQHPHTTVAGTYDNTKVNGLVILNVDSEYVNLTNLAFTKEAPVANFANPMIDYIDGIIATKNWKGDVTDIYLDPIYGYDSRLFVGLGRTIDATKAQYLEFDIYCDAKMNDLGVWLCNNYDAVDGNNGRNFYHISTSQAVPGEWTHIVVELASAFSYNAGTFYMDRWTSIFFQGDPNAPGTELNVKIANLGISKNYPDINPTYNLVKVAKDGLISVATVPANTSMYPSCQMWQMFEGIEMKNVDYIELDIYASDATEAEILLHTSVDSATVRGFWTIPKLNAGWNHVVIDKIEDYAGSHVGMLISDLDVWSAYFFEGVPSTSKDITFKIANVITTKFAPDPKYTFTEVTSHPEIAVDTTGYADGFTAKSDFDKIVDLSKGDTAEFDVFVSTVPEDDVITTLTDAEDVSATFNISAKDLTEGWNHIIIDLNNLDAEEGFSVKNVASIRFTGKDSIRFVVANFALTAEETVKNVMDYNGKVFSKFEGYEETFIPAASDISESTSPIVLPMIMNLEGIDYIEMNLYVSAKCDLSFNLNATPFDEGGVYEQATAYYELQDLTYGWNQVHIAVSDLIANDWFEPSAVTYMYLSGIADADNDVTFAVEDLAVTTNSIDFDIEIGDYNVDGEVDMLDLIHTINLTLSEENVWFANVAEAEGAADSFIDALDIAGLKKLLFANF